MLNLRRVIGPTAAAVLFIAAFLLLFYQSERLITLKAGLNVCLGACRRFDELSGFLAANGYLPDGVEVYLWPSYRLLILVLAGLKWLFGEHWQEAFAVFEAVALAATVGLAAFLWRHSCNALLMFAVGLALVVVDLRVLMAAKILLTDLLFSSLAVPAFILLATGVARDCRLIVAGCAVAALSMFARPTGVLVACVALAAATTLPLPGRRKTVFAALLAVGCVAAMIGVAAVSLQAARGEALGPLPPRALSALVTNNVAAGDARFGTYVVNVPYKLILPHDGGLVGTVTTMAMRMVKAFEIPMPGYGASHNAYRWAFYLLLYGLAGLGAWRARYDGDHTQALAIAGALAYQALFTTLVPVEQRYLIPVDLTMIACAAWGVARQFPPPRRDTQEFA